MYSKKNSFQWSINEQLNFHKPLPLELPLSFFEATETGKRSEERDAFVSAFFTDSCKILETKA